MSKNILITGAAGYIGSILLEKLSQHYTVIGLDLRADDSRAAPIVQGDIRDPSVADLMLKHEITHVVHLASVIEASDDPARDYDIDVNGTKNIIESCLRAKVEHLCVASSGAAYGYHADNPEWLDEHDPVRGSDEFPYSKHKRIVEDMLAAYRQSHPELKQLILRPGTVLGANTHNLITNLFRMKRILAVQGSASPYVFIWDEDVVNIMEQGVSEEKTGIYNLAGDGALPIREIAALLHKPVLSIPPHVLKSALWIGKKLQVSRYGPEQLKFLQYRPVLSNRRLKEEFGYTPQKTSKECFLYYAENARKRGDL